MPIALLAVVATLFGLGSCSRISAPGMSGSIPSVTIGMKSTAANSLIYIAEDRRYFSANGLAVTVKQYSSVLAAMDGLSRGEVDIAAASEFILVGKALAREGIITFGSIDRFMHNEILGRKDRGIEKIVDLRGKRIGVPLRTAAEFYLARFLDLHGLNRDEAIFVHVSPAQSVQALAGGEIDAVIAWPPHVKAIEDRLSSAVIKWPAQSERATYCSLLCTAAWAAVHPELINRFLKALVQAEDYLVRHTEEARNSVQQKLGYTDAYMADIWSQHRPAVSLDQSLLLAMEEEARWMISNHLTGETEKTPDLLSCLYLNGLQAVRPEAVYIIR